MLILLALFSCEQEATLSGVFTGEALLAHCESSRRIAVTGSVVMSVEDASGLDCLVSVTDDLSLYGAGGGAAPDLLPKLIEVGGDLRIENAIQLSAITGLDALTTLGGDLSLSSLAAVGQLQAFGALTTVGGDLTLSSLPRLGEAESLAVSEVGGSVQIQDTGLADLSLLGELTAAQQLVILGNKRLTSLSGLEALSSLHNEDLTGEEQGELYIGEHPWLEDISALAGVDWTDADVQIDSSAALHDLRAFAGTTAMGEVQLSPFGYATLEGLESLQTVRGLAIHDFFGLTSLDSLSSLREVTGDLSLYNNTSLRDISALVGTLERVGGDLSITGNAELSCEQIDALLDVVVVGGSLNDSDCDDTDTK